MKIIFGEDLFSEKKIFFSFDIVSKEIAERTEKRVGKTKNISNNPILLDIYSPDYPDLQFIDLPGFTKTCVQDQPSDICEQIEKLNVPILQNPNTIILAIQSATEDIGMSTALEYALRDDIDPEGARTIGVLTKLDNLVATTDKERVARVLSNKTKPLKYGYFGVVNRSQDSIDRGDNMNQTKKKEMEVFSDSNFSDVTSRLGIDGLRSFISSLLASRMEQIIPDVKQRVLDDLHEASKTLKEYGSTDEEGMEYEDLIGKLVERAMKKISINMQGQSVQVTMDAEGTGAKLNKIIKHGAIEASKNARQKLSIGEFHKKLSIAKRNVAAIRDNPFPQGIVLDIGVALLTECYREPFLQLLDKSSNFLKNEIGAILKETLGMYPKFQNLVSVMALEEINVNREKAEEYLNVQIDIHKKFVNCDHVEFVKMTKIFTSTGKKRNCNLWFKEKVPATEDTLPRSTSKDSIWDSLSGGSEKQEASKAIGFFERLQNISKNIRSYKLPVEDEDEALLHIDLCLEYMEIIDKALIDEVPKIFIMMLSHKLLDFLVGGESYRTSLLRKVQKEMKTLRAEDILVKNPEHMEIINNLKKKKQVAQSTLDVLDNTIEDLSNVTNGVPNLDFGKVGQVGFIQDSGNNNKNLSDDKFSIISMGGYVPPKQIWLSEEKGKGLQISATWSLKNNLITMEMTFNNKGLQPLKNFALQLNKNSFGLMPSQSLNIPNLNLGQSLDVSLQMSTNGQVQKTDPLNLLQMAIKHNLDVFYFTVQAPIHIFFSKDGNMEMKTFLNAWKEIPATNEVQYTIVNIDSTSDVIEMKMAKNNVFTVAKTTLETHQEAHGDMIIQSMKITGFGGQGIWGLMEIKLVPNNHNIILTFKSRVLEVAQLIFQAYDAILHN